MLAAQKGTEQIAVEVKSFIGRSEVEDLEQALGQYLLYRSLLSRRDPGRTLYLAAATDAFNGILSTALGRAAVEDYEVKLLVFSPAAEVIEQWLK